MLTHDVDNKSIRVMPAVLFYISTFQNGLIELDPDNCFIELYQNICLLICGGLLHNIYKVVHLLFNFLSTSQPTSLNMYVLYKLLLSIIYS